LLTCLPACLPCLSLSAHLPASLSVFLTVFTCTSATPDWQPLQSARVLEC
jgi:hypothetical protein